jgi:hypothetical protein
MSSDADAIEELLRASKAGSVHKVLHYLYFPSRDKASINNAASLLRSQAFTTQERRGADGASWLVLAQHELIPSVKTIGAARQIMEQLTSPDGEYDGWEAEVVRTEP